MVVKLVSINISKDLLCNCLANQSQIYIYMKEWGTSVYINPGCLTKMSAMPIYIVKTLQISSSPEQVDGYQGSLA